MDRGSCIDAHPEVFFPVGRKGGARADATDAKAICAACPVTTECLSWAMGNSIEHGVWGGLDEDERRALKRRESRGRVAKCGTVSGARQHTRNGEAPCRACASARHEGLAS